MKNSLTLYKVEYCQLRNTEFSQEDTVSVDSDKEICQTIQPLAELLVEPSNPLLFIRPNDDSQPIRPKYKNVKFHIKYKYFLLIWCKFFYFRAVTRPKWGRNFVIGSGY